MDRRVFGVQKDNHQIVNDSLGKVILDKPTQSVGCMQLRKKSA